METTIAVDLIKEAAKAVVIAGPPLIEWAKLKFRGSAKDKVYSTSISEFWEDKEGVLEKGRHVSIQGALCKYIPMLIGPPKAKREVHRVYRRSKLEKGYEKNRTDVDANLAFTAGQMVWRLPYESLGWVPLGLYHSIVRNSIPVFVYKDYYREIVEKLFTKGRSTYTVEAKVEGILGPIPENFINKFIKENKLASKIKPKITSAAAKPIFGIMVEGQNTKIEYSGEARYLDGDIWVAVESNGKQKFVSRFLDLADDDDLRQESQNLKKDVEELYPKGKIIFQFDQVDKPITAYQTVPVKDLIEEWNLKP